MKDKLYSQPSVASSCSLLFTHCLPCAPSGWRAAATSPTLRSRACPREVGCGGCECGTRLGLHCSKAWLRPLALLKPIKLLAPVLALPLLWNGGMPDAGSLLEDSLVHSLLCHFNPPLSPSPWEVIKQRNTSSSYLQWIIFAPDYAYTDPRWLLCRHAPSQFMHIYHPGADRSFAGSLLHKSASNGFRVLAKPSSQSEGLPTMPSVLQGLVHLLLGVPSGSFLAREDIRLWQLSSGKRGALQVDAATPWLGRAFEILTRVKELNTLSNCRDL